VYGICVYAYTDINICIFMNIHTSSLYLDMPQISGHLLTYSYIIYYTYVYITESGQTEFINMYMYTICCIYVYICQYICTYVYVHMYAYIYTYIYIHVCICVRYVHTYPYIYAHI